MNHVKFTQVVALIAVAVLLVVSLVEQINIVSGTWHMTADLANEFFFIPIRREDLKEFAFT